MTDRTPAPTGAPQLRPLYTNIAPADVGALIEDAFDVGTVSECVLLRRGFNDVFSVTTTKGRHFARLSHRRARGPANAAYEGALLSHLKGRGASVAAALATKDGAFSRDIDCPEGARALMVFEVAPGEATTPTSVGHPAAHGAGLARIHEASADYVGPASRYRLDLDHLLRRPLARILAAPHLTEANRAALPEIAAELEERFAAREASLSSIACHGDCHGGNAHIAAGPDGQLVATFFDFDDGGPGYLAYDIGVFLWSTELRRDGGGDAKETRGRWTEFLQGYRGVREIPSADIAGAALFVPIRQFWLMGEYAARIPEWGYELFSNSWLDRQVKLLREWASLDTSGD